MWARNTYYHERTLFHKVLQVKIDAVDLSILRFRDGLKSAFLSPIDFSWSVHRPSTSMPGEWREVDKAEVLKDGGAPLHLAAQVQPWTNLRLKLEVGVISTSDLTKEGEANHPRFPMVGVYSGFLVFSHSDAVKGTGLPTMPFLIDNREVEEEALPDLPLPTSLELKEAIFKLFSDTTAPHMKSNMDKLHDALQGDWRKTKPSKYTFPVQAAEGDENESDAETGLAKE